ncbi:cytochrome c [Sneathiella sp.]|uniref:c-type cytochrome n=1 Tax=Sneathiella sp. TaxID=1964365 RepID=UPI00356AFD54
MVTFVPAVIIALSANMLTLTLAYAEESRQGRILEGKALARQFCSRCHAVTPGEESPFSEAPPFQEIVGRWPLSYLEEALAEGISVGHDAMPEFRLKPREIDNFLVYLSSLPK